MVIVGLISLAIGKPGDYQQVSPGNTISLDDSEARSLIARGLAQASSKQEDAMDISTDIVDAIHQLSPDDFGKDGKPNVRALEAILGFDISAKDRDLVWKQYQELQD